MSPLKGGVPITTLPKISFKTKIWKRILPHKKNNPEVVENIEIILALAPSTANTGNKIFDWAIDERLIHASDYVYLDFLTLEN